MQAVEIVAMLGVAAVLATGGYRVANERRDAARVVADLDAVAAVAMAYQATGADCGRPSGKRVEVEDMLVALGGARSGPAAAAAWSVRFYSRSASPTSGWPPVRPPHIAGFAFDIVRGPGATAAERATLERLGARLESADAVLAWRADRGGRHRLRRAFAAGRAFRGC